MNKPKTAFDLIFEAANTPADRFETDSAWAHWLYTQARAALTLMREERINPTPTLECLTLDPSRLNPADLERLKRVFANPLPDYRGMFLRGECIVIDEPTPRRTISFDPALCAPYVGTRYNKDDLPKDIYASFATELSKCSPDTFREQYECTFDPLAWISHNGGPCPVRHGEVEVQTRGSVTGPRRCWPESVNWHWGRPGSPTTPIDVLRWRRV